MADKLGIQRIYGAPVKERSEMQCWGIYFLSNLQMLELGEG